MLLYAYKYKGGENRPVLKVLPIDPNGYSHGITSWYANCSYTKTAHRQRDGQTDRRTDNYATSNLNRVRHFKTANVNVLKMAIWGRLTHYSRKLDVSQDPSFYDVPRSCNGVHNYYMSGTTKLSRQSAILPNGTTVVGRSPDWFLWVLSTACLINRNCYLWVIYPDVGSGTLIWMWRLIKL